MTSAPSASQLAATSSSSGSGWTSAQHDLHALRGEAFAHRPADARRHRRSRRRPGRSDVPCCRRLPVDDHVPGRRGPRGRRSAGGRTAGCRRATPSDLISPLCTLDRSPSSTSRRGGREGRRPDRSGASRSVTVVVDRPQASGLLVAVAVDESRIAVETLPCGIEEELEVEVGAARRRGRAAGRPSCR